MCSVVPFELQHIHTPSTDILGSKDKQEAILIKSRVMMKINKLPHMRKNHKKNSVYDFGVGN